MAFEENTHQQHNEELTQLQKQKENEQFQRELDKIIARLENEQFQKELDEIIERLAQESQQPPSTQEELSSHESVSEEDPEQLNILETSTQSFDNQRISHDKENTEEEQTQNQDLTVTEYSIQKEQDIAKDQEVELNLLQMREDHIQFQQDLDAINERLNHASQQSPPTEEESSSHDSVMEKDPEQLNSLEQSTQSSDEQSIFHQKEYTEEQRTQNLDLKKAENSLQERSWHKSVTGIKINERKNNINQNVNKQIIREQNGKEYDKEIQEKKLHNTDQAKEDRNKKDLKKQDIEVKTKRKEHLKEEPIEEKHYVKELRKNKHNGSNKNIQQDVRFQKEVTPTISHNHVQTLLGGSHTHVAKPRLKHLSFSNINSDLLQEFRRASKSNYQGDITPINQFITKVNTQLHGDGDLNSGVHDILAKLGTNERYPNLVMVYGKDGQKSLELLDAKLYDKLLEYQKLGNFRLEWQRFWFEGLRKIEPSYNFRRVFLVDFTDHRTLPPDMRRIWAVKNSYTWNAQTPTKRELHSKSIKDFFGTLFEERPKHSNFKDVKDYTYQKKMNYVWKKIREVFSSEIILQTTKRPAIYPLKREQSREKIEHALIGTFWHYYNSLNRVGKRNLKGWGYYNLLKFMEKEADGIYRTIVDPNYVGQKFTVRVTNKSRAFSKFLDGLKELQKSGQLDSNYAINKIYREWILKSELQVSKDLNEFSWTVDKARQRRTIIFKDIRDLMDERNTYGVGAVLEALFEDESFIERINKITRRKFSTKLICFPSGSARINTDATSIAYPDLTITQSDGKPVHVQIKDLGKSYNQEKEEWVLVDQLKTLFGASDNFENVTVHVINALDILDVVDPDIHPNLAIHNGSNFGLINIGIWENIEGINKFGEIFSALRTLHEAGYNGKDAIEKALNYLQKIHPVVDTDDVSLVETLERMWSENLAELILNISEHFGDYFKDKTVGKEKLEEKDLEKQKISQEQLPVTPIQTQSLLQTHKEFRSTIKGGVLIKRLERRLEHQPLFQRYWLECTGQTEVAGDTSKQEPRGLIVDLTKDSFLPARHRKVYMVKNNLRWNVLGYKDKQLSLGSFNEFTKLLFNNTTLKRNFNGKSKYPLYIWKRVKTEWNLVERAGFNLIPNVKRPQIYMLKDEYLKIKSPIQRKRPQIEFPPERINNKSSIQNKLSNTFKANSIERFIKKINDQVQSGIRLKIQDLKMLKKLNTEEKYPNLTLIRNKNKKISLELLEPKLYSQLKENLKLGNNRLSFQRFWFECTGQIEVAGRTAKQTPRGLTVDLTRDSFLPKRHRLVYLVKNSKYWNTFGYKDSSLSAGSFDKFIRFLFTKKTIKDFSQNVQYPRYIWEQIKATWNLTERPGFKLKPQGYRPNIFVLKEVYTKSLVEKTMIGVYQEYISSLDHEKRRALRRNGFRYLAEFIDQAKDIPKVVNPLQVLEWELDSLMRDLL